MRWLLFLTFLSAAPPGPTLIQRKRFAEAHAAKAGPIAVDFKATACQRWDPPAALGCAKSAYLCPKAWGNSMCDGSNSEWRGLSLHLALPSEDEREAEPLPELMLESDAWNDCPECACARRTCGGSVDPKATPAQQAQGQRRIAEHCAAEHRKCLAEEKRRAEAERVKRKCALLLVDPCRQEAFIRCTGKNGEQADPPTGRTLQFSFAPGADGGRPRGGEWEPEDAAPP